VTELNVRRAQPEDLDFVGQDGYIPMAILSRKIVEGDVFVAEVDASPAAYLRLEYLWSTTPYIALIRVLEGFRGRGIGRSLLAFVESELKLTGHTALYSSSQADEPRPQAWHRHMGFEECGIISGLNEGGVGEVFFRKQL
jgi:GNAT superfamily N-acetyltransferase